MDPDGHIEPATLPQIKRARNGRMVLIDADAGGVADELRRIHEGLKLRYSEPGGYYVVYFDDGSTHYMILTAQECDHRIVHRLRKIDGHGRSGYDYAKELERADVERREQAAERFRNAIEEHAAELQFALRKDLGIKDRVFVANGIPRA